MILIVSSTPRESAALIGLCEGRGWPCAGCDSMRALRRRLKSTRPAIVVTRHKIADGYSDDVFSALAHAALLPDTKVVVLLGAGATAAQEARQIALGADNVQRDPVRADVLLEYLGKYRRQAKRAVTKKTRDTPPERGHFAGATMHWADHRLTHAGQSLILSPREAQLIELLAESRGEIVTFDTLYDEILDRRFTGDTAVIRVLVARLIRKVATIGVPLRERLRSVLKRGYRYDEAHALPRSSTQADAG